MDALAALARDTGPAEISDTCTWAVRGPAAGGRFFPPLMPRGRRLADAAGALCVSGRLAPIPAEGQNPGNVDGERTTSGGGEGTAPEQVAGGRYRLVGKIGSGGMAVVYVA